MTLSHDFLAWAEGFRRQVVLKASSPLTVLTAVNHLTGGHRSRWELEPWQKIGGPPVVERDPAKCVHEISELSGPYHAICHLCGAELTLELDTMPYPWPTGGTFQEVPKP